MRDNLERQVEDAMTAMVARDAIAVPPYPAVALKLGKLLRREGYGLDEVVALVAADATLSADLLRCANSSAHARGIEVRSLSLAVTRLGAKEVQRIAVASTLAKAAQAAGPLEVVKRSAWQCSVASAVLCEELAKLRGLAQEDAFLCGLLHDYGSLIALTALEEILAEMPEARSRPRTAWVALIDRVHVKLGLLLATKWKLPRLFQDAIALHHDSSTTWSGPHASLLEAVANSDAIVRLMVVRSSVDAAAMLSIPGLADRDRFRLAERIPDIPNIIASFEQDAPPGPTPLSRLSVPPAAALPDGFRSIELGVQQLQPKTNRYVLRGIAEDGWMMTGRDPVAEGALLEVELETQPDSIVVWAKATHCRRAADGTFAIECKPFATSGTTSARLFELLRSAAAA
jgi:HD-like signal output (HDOD) protein